ncbi:MAG: DEAD/DEAH box helicase family protein [Patescibacteria group bacterium]|nr:DEAD/DEAH box helicase family protein [Patescibacteria group bacterium]
MSREHRVEVTLTNTHAVITRATDEQWAQLSDYWSFFAPNARWVPSYKLYLRTRKEAERENDPSLIQGWDGMVRLLKNDGSLAAGVYRATKKEIKEKLGIRFSTTWDLPDIRIRQAKLYTGEEKYQYQYEAVKAMCENTAAGGGIILSATGTGKTKEASDYFYQHDYPSLFVVNRKTLMYQTKKELEYWLHGEEVGIVGDGVKQIRRVTVATVQTLQLYAHTREFEKWFDMIKIVFVDELHKQMAKSNFKLLNQIRPIARFGLTASLQMKKKAVRYKAWEYAGPVIYEFPYAEARDREVLAEGHVLQLRFPDSGLDYDGDWREEYLAEVVENETKLKACSLIARWLIESGRSVILLVNRQAHVAALRALFRDVKHRVAYGPVKQTRRAVALKKFEAGKIKLMIASSIFEEGINIKRVSAIIDLAEFRSKDSALQKFGRGVRLHLDKSNLVYIDIGTETGRYRKAAVSRQRALRAAGVPVTVVKVGTPKAAKSAVVAFCHQLDGGGA